jgi:hypothetical protein
MVLVKRQLGKNRQDATVVFSPSTLSTSFQSRAISTVSFASGGSSVRDVETDNASPGK